MVAWSVGELSKLRRWLRRQRCVVVSWLTVQAEVVAKEAEVCGGGVFFAITTHLCLLCHCLSLDNDLTAQFTPTSH